jgi:glycosyltransferase involved in cell wall biosynthesis
MRIGVVIDETWAFFNEIFAEFEEHHETSLYKPRQIPTPFLRERINRMISAYDMQKFLGGNDVVFFEWASHLLAVASQYPKNCGIVTRLHRYEMYQWVDQIRWEVVDRIILVSQAKRNEFQGLFPYLAHKLVVIPEAVSLMKFQPNQKPFDGDIGILCHLAPRKRVYELILVFSELRKTHPNLHLHIGGGPRPMYPDYYTSLQSIVERLDISRHVTFYGSIEDPATWYHNIDIFISNSYSEGLQVSPMEAMASGCFCLSHWWDGADELLPETNLYLTDRELIEKIEEYIDLSDEGKRRRCELLRRTVQNRFDVDKTKVEIRKLVEEVGRSWTEG